MSQYNKTVLTRAGLELAKRANAGQAKFGITRAVTSADDWSNKTVQDLEEVTTIPNIMQQGTIMDAEEVESNNSVIGVSLCFTNKNLSTGYQIRIIGLYVKEEGQENDFLYAVTTAITPESMPSFADKVLYKFNMQMYLVIGNAQSVNVVINEGTAVTSTQFNKYKGEVTESLKELENTHKEDMSHVAKSASVNGGAEILPDSTGKLNLVVPDPDLSEYVSLEQLGELLKTKADKVDVYTKTETNNQINKFDLSKIKFRKQYLNGNGNKVYKTWSATKNEDGTYTIDLLQDDYTAYKLFDVLAQLPNKADTSTVNAQIADAKNTIKSNVDNLQSAVNTKANASDVYTKKQVDDAFSSRDATIANKADKSYVDDKVGAIDFSKIKFRKQYVTGNNKTADSTWQATKNADGTYTIDLLQDDWTAQRVVDVLAQLPNKADTSTVNAQIADAKNTIKSNVDNLQSAVNTKANASDVYTKKQVDDAFSSRDATIANKADKSYVDDKVGAIDFSKIKFRKQYVTGNNKTADSTWQATKNADGTYTIDLWQDDWTAQRVVDLLNQIGSKANASDVNSLQNLINQQNQTIQSLTTRLANAENEIRYIKANYVEGRTFPASQEAQANSWENANPQRIAFIER